MKWLSNEEKITHNNFSIAIQKMDQQIGNIKLSSILIVSKLPHITEMPI